jgi:hypothetical protein
MRIPRLKHTRHCFVEKGETPPGKRWLQLVRVMQLPSVAESQDVLRSAQKAPGLRPQQPALNETIPRTRPVPAEHIGAVRFLGDDTPAAK